MRKIFLFVILSFFVFGGCVNKSISPSEDKKQDLRVVQERKSEYPLILSKGHSSHLKAPATSFEDYLGRALRTDSIPFILENDITYPVIDVSRYHKDYPNTDSPKGSRTTQSRAFSFATFDRYREQSFIDHQVNCNPSLDKDVFKFGVKNRFDYIFSESKINESNQVYGVAYFEYRSALFELRTNSYLNKIIRRNYLHDDFKHDLYNLSPKQVLNTYGAFVVNKFITGARSTLLFSAEGKTGENQIELEEDMFDAVSLSTKTYIKITDFQSDELSLSTAFKKFTNTSVSINTIGGVGKNSGFSAGKDINAADLDLTSWAAFGVDENNYSIIDIAFDGMIPLWEFVLEDNIKNQIKLLMAGNGLKSNLAEPFLLTFGEETSPQTLVLSTRFNDMILLDRRTETNNLFSNIKSGSYFDIKRLHTDHRDMHKYLHFRTGMNVFKNKYFDWNNFKKYTDKEGVIYLLDETNNAGLSIHFDELLDTYGIRPIVDNLPQINDITMSRLEKYHLIAL
jgi:hypothetical protein